MCGRSCFGRHSRVTDVYPFSLIPNKDLWGMLTQGPNALSAASFLVPPQLGGFRVPSPGEDLFSFLLQNFHLIDYHLAAFITVMLARRLVWALISEVTFPLFPLLPVVLTAEHDHPWPEKVL